MDEKTFEETQELPWMSGESNDFSRDAAAGITAGDDKLHVDDGLKTGLLVDADIGIPSVDDLVLGNVGGAMPEISAAQVSPPFIETDFTRPLEETLAVCSQMTSTSSSSSNSQNLFPTFSKSIDNFQSSTSSACDMSSQDTSSSQINEAMEMESSLFLPDMGVGSLPLIPSGNISDDITDTAMSNSAPFVSYDSLVMPLEPMMENSTPLVDVDASLVERALTSVIEEKVAHNYSHQSSDLAPTNGYSELKSVEESSQKGLHVPDGFQKSELDQTGVPNASQKIKLDQTGEVPVEEEETEFVWEEYLEETGSTAVPPTAFKHVEFSLQSGFVKGMKLEVPNKGDSDTYWVAMVVMTCGPLLRLRFEGYEEDSSADFWCDLSTSEVHTIGWCSQNGKTLQPPEAIKGKFVDWSEFLVKTLTGAQTAPSYLLDKNTGTTPIDQIKRGMKLELQNLANPLHVWLIKVVENVGGRLYLRYEGAQSGSHDFWLFYLDYRIHPVGWAKERQGYTYQPPQEIKDKGHHGEDDWVSLLETALKEAEEMSLPPDVLKDQIEIIDHRFQANHKLEALNPVTRNQICPATVKKVLSAKYFIIEIDDLDSDDGSGIQFCCHARSSGIYPISWCMGNGIKLTPPKGWNRPDFNWSEYLSYCKTPAAPDNCFNLRVPPHEFERGLKLEAVNPNCPNQICAATVTKLSDRLLWIHLEGGVKVVASHIEDIESHNLYPVGWCESNSYQLKHPRKGNTTQPAAGGKQVAVVQPERSEGSNLSKHSVDINDDQGNGWCPKIYFNHKCFSGPYLSKGRIAELPKCVGPGPINLVMKEVLSMLISVAYKSCRVLREIQLEGPANPNMHQQVLKAKYKTKSYRAIVEICKSLDQLEEFCRQICIKLECCPNLISTQCVGERCPEICSQLTKTKYTYYYGKKKRKIGRPPGGHSNLENGPKKVGKRKKRKKINLVRKSRSTKDSTADDDNTSAISGSSESKSVEESYDLDPDPDMDLSVPRGKRKYTHHVHPPSEIQTRGAKMLKFGFERKTHKKILLNVNSTENALSMKSKELHRKHSPKKSKSESILKLHSNPLSWSLAQVVEFIKTTDCAHLARLFKEHEIDGQALLLLTLPTVQEHMGLKLGPAIKLCHHIELVKIAFYETYAK